MNAEINDFFGVPQRYLEQKKKDKEKGGIRRK